MQSLDVTKAICEGKGCNSGIEHRVVVDHEPELTVLQQPVAAAQSNGPHDKNGVAIDPFPIVELTFEGLQEAWRQGHNELNTYKYIMHCSVLGASDTGNAWGYSMKSIYTSF
ncbi:hypothetical protein FSARC_11920 [Fusarium sarcochroum]|uniref:Velvet domain-containing protein n=1 Tax=Fusarium sarcochroum TaxID=1208366 RepID=A0A8H4TC42_9HYPO|nr:hypothetical protein FSARC_11920 [Fusarium sarcochroum]